MTRVELRVIRNDDWPRIHEWTSELAACRYQAWGPHDADATQRFVAEAVAVTAAATKERRVWVAEAADHGVVGLGEIKIHSMVHRQAEISYSVHVSLWGRGIGESIASALIEVCLSEGMHRVMGTCDPRNVASARVLEKVGMTFEGRMRHTLLIRDGWRDSDVYALIAGEE